MYRILTVLQVFCGWSTPKKYCRKKAIKLNCKSLDLLRWSATPVPQSRQYEHKHWFVPNARLRIFAAPAHACRHARVYEGSRPDASRWHIWIARFGLARGFVFFEYQQWGWGKRDGESSGDAPAVVWRFCWEYHLFLSDKSNPNKPIRKVANEISCNSYY